MKYVTQLKYLYHFNNSNPFRLQTMISFFISTCCFARISVFFFPKIFGLPFRLPGHIPVGQFLVRLLGTRVQIVWKKCYSWEQTKSLSLSAGFIREIFNCRKTPAFARLMRILEVVFPPICHKYRSS